MHIVGALRALAILNSLFGFFGTNNTELNESVVVWLFESAFIALVVVRVVEVVVVGFVVKLLGDSLEAFLGIGRSTGGDKEENALLGSGFDSKLMRLAESVLL